MTGHLPSEFFKRFFEILPFDPKEAEGFGRLVDELCERAYAHALLEALPETERQTYSQLLEQEGISSATVAEFVALQIDDQVQALVWQQALTTVWGEIMGTIGQKASSKQKAEVLELLREYSEGA